MKYHNAHIRNEQDSTLCLRAYSQKQNLSRDESIPIVVLCMLLAGLLLSCLPI